MILKAGIHVTRTTRAHYIRHNESFAGNVGKDLFPFDFLFNSVIVFTKSPCMQVGLYHTRHTEINQFNTI